MEKLRGIRENAMTTERLQFLEEKIASIREQVSATQNFDNRYQEFATNWGLTYNISPKLRAYIVLITHFFISLIWPNNNSSRKGPDDISQQPRMDVGTQTHEWEQTEAIGSNASNECCSGQVIDHLY